jgi:flagellar biosynthesis/type III secretory pathway chaperone
VDPNVCREHFEKLLGEETAALSRLESLLDREHELLVANDVDELERTGEERQNCIGELIRIEDERRALCRMLNVPMDATGIERLMTWCDPTHTLQARWSQCADQATRCRAANDRNGALVTARMKKVEGMLDVLTGRAHEPKTYGKQGAYSNAAAGPRLTVTV